MKKEAEDMELKKYPHLKKYLDESNQKYNFDSPEDLFNLFNIILKVITKKRKLEQGGIDKKELEVKKSDNS